MIFVVLLRDVHCGEKPWSLEGSALGPILQSLKDSTPCRSRVVHKWVKGYAMPVPATFSSSRKSFEVSEKISSE